VQVNVATGRVQHAHGPINGPANFGGGKFGIETGRLLPPWLDERRTECDVLRYEERTGVVSALTETEATLTMDGGSEMTVPKSDIALIDSAHVKIGMPIVSVSVGDRPPKVTRDPRTQDARS